jgi:acetolactate synthase-1/2/3 large subunit
MEKIAKAYGIAYIRVKNEKDIEKSIEAIEKDGPILIEVIVDSEQNFEPKLSSKVLPDGTIVSPDIDDMYPFIERNEYEAIKNTINTLNQ